MVATDGCIRFGVWFYVKVLLFFIGYCLLVEMLKRYNIAEELFSIANDPRVITLALLVVIFVFVVVSKVRGWEKE